MSPGELLKILRSRGYTVCLHPDGSITAEGVRPKDPQRAAQMLADHHQGLRAILEAEQVLGGVLK